MRYMACRAKSASAKLVRFSVALMVALSIVPDKMGLSCDRGFLIFLAQFMLLNELAVSVIYTALLSALECQ